LEPFPVQAFAAIAPPKGRGVAKLKAEMGRICPLRHPDCRAKAGSWCIFSREWLAWCELLKRKNTDFPIRAQQNLRENLRVRGIFTTVPSLSRPADHARMVAGHNPFGFSSTNPGSLYKGLVRDTSKNVKHLRHTATPITRWTMPGATPRPCWQRDEMGLKVRL
jgi:hypothetical protein